VKLLPAPDITKASKKEAFNVVDKHRVIIISVSLIAYAAFMPETK